MARARIEVNGLHVDAVNVTVGIPVLLSNDDNGGETTYTWTLIDKPEGSTATLSNTTIENPQFTPDKEGSYQLRLVVNITTGSQAIDFCSIAVLRDLDSERVPAAAETIETGSVKGWCLAVNRILNRALDQLASGGPVIAAQTPGGFAPGAIVRVLAGLATTATGQHEVPVLAAATGSAAAVRGLLGVVIDGAVAGSLTAGTIALVRIFGLAPLSVAGSPAVGDPVYVSNAGLPALTPGTYPRRIGAVVSASGGNFRWAVEGRDADLVGGGIVGDYQSAGAEVAYVDADNAYTFKQPGSPRPFAIMQGGPVDLFEPVAGVTEAVRLQSPASLAAGYAVTWPDELPAETGEVLMSSTGVLSVDPGPHTIQLPASAFHIADESIAGPRILDNDGFVTTTSAGGGTFVCPVVLQAGRVISSVQVFYNPDGGGPVTPGFRRIKISDGTQNPVWTGTGDSVGTAITSQTGSALDHEVVATDAYEIRVFVSDAANRVHGAIVTYA